MAKTLVKDKKKGPGEEVRLWLNEIASARKREKSFRKDGQNIIDIYSGEKSDAIPFNILFSNTETLLPALFSQTPKPVVQRRFKDEDPIGLAASKAAERMLLFLCDTNIEGYETFEQAMRAATLDGLVPGRGVTAIKYDADIDEPGQDSTSAPAIAWELVVTESVKWDRIYFGFARKWSKMPWIAYEEYIDKEEATRLFDKEIADKINFTKGEDDDEEKEKRGSGTGGREEAENDYGERKTALIYQIWDKAGGKKIRYVSPHYTDDYLKIEDDPYKITGFFNCPKPIQFIEKSNDLTPTAMYTLYENQAKELNRITIRLNRVLEAMKVRGAYDSALGSDIEKILKEDDNALIPTDRAATLAAEGGLDKAIWFMPIEKLITVATNLIQAREQTKRVIYEITGISDILRGQSMASETLGAQKIKEGWGTMRMKRLQREVQRYCRDALRIMLDISTQQFTVDSWAKMTGLPYVKKDQHDKAKQLMQTSQQQAQLMASQAQMQGQPPAPMPPPDPKIIEIIQAPIWEEVLALLKNDQQRACQVDIETNSTIDVEATEEKQNISEFLTAVGQFMGQMAPAMERGGMPFDAVKAMLLEVSRRFRFGTEVEEELKKMAQPPPDNSQMQSDQMKIQGEMQMRQAELQAQGQAKQSEMQMQMQIEQAKHEREIQTEQAKGQLEIQKLQMARESELIQINAERESESRKLQSQRDTEKFKAMIQQETELKKAELQSATQLEIARINSTQDQAENQPPAAGKQVNEIMAQMMELMKVATAPKIIQRDANGRAIGIISDMSKTGV
jgi:hypothetical protein